jgi:putative two-component system response regulator
MQARREGRLESPADAKGLVRPVSESSKRPGILIVDDSITNLQVLSRALKEQGYEPCPIQSGRAALAAAHKRAPDLILLDINMPELDGYEVCAQLKSDPRTADIPVIFVSSLNEPFDKVRAFSSGGVDYLTKPVNLDEVHARVETHLKLRRLQLDLNRKNQHLQQLVAEQVREISDAQLATIIAITKLSECRDQDTGRHVVRVQHYCRKLARQVAREGAFGKLIDDAFLNNLYHASAMHDIGKVGIPDSILLKPARLTPEEFELIKKHTIIGAETLSAVARSYPQNALLRMGMEVARSHHEHWDGSGYPDGLAGEAIPLSARIMTLADQYDALRTRRPYKPALDGATTYNIITEGDGKSVPSHFDPRILKAFKRVAANFDTVYEELGE